MSEIVVPEYVINCDADPFVPDGYTVVEHQKGGAFKWNAANVALYLDEGQMGNKIEGNELRKALAGKPVLNANVLNYLIDRQHLIPEEWKGKAVFFWGTIYLRWSHFLCVRCLYWGGGRWRTDFCWIRGDWSAKDPAVVAVD